jgi:hypothetical protein
MSPYKTNQSPRNSTKKRKLSKEEDERNRLLYYKKNENQRKIQKSQKQGTYLYPYDKKHDPYVSTVYQKETEGQAIIDRQRHFNDLMDHEERGLQGLTFGGKKKQKKTRKHRKQKN